MKLRTRMWHRRTAQVRVAHIPPGTTQHDTWTVDELPQTWDRRLALIGSEDKGKGVSWAESDTTDVTELLIAHTAHASPSFVRL